MKNILACIALACVLPAKAQFNLGVATGNYCTMNGLNLNPAVLGGTKERYCFSIASFGLGVDNNVGSFDPGKGLIVAVGSGKTDNMFQYSTNSRISTIAPYGELAGPSMMMRLDKVTSAAFTMRLRGINQFNNFDQTLFHTFSDPAYRPEKNISTSVRDFNYTVHMWGELGLSVGRVLYENKKGRLSAGLTARYLGGLAYVAVNGSKMDVTFQQNKDTLSVTDVNLQYESNFLYTKPGQGTNASANVLKLIGGGNGGFGFGGDLGGIYEFNPKGLRRGYLVKFMASVLDVGAVVYRSDNNTQGTFSGKGKVTGKGIIDNVRNFSSIQRYLAARGFTTAVTQVSTRVHLPTRLVIGGDYNAYKHYYVSLLFVGNVAKRNTIGNSYYNQWTIAPRYEIKEVSLALPVTFSTLSNTFKVGVGVAGAGLFLGSDDLLAVFSKSQSGINFYGGFNIPINK